MPSSPPPCSKFLRLLVALLFFFLPGLKGSPLQAVAMETTGGVRGTGECAPDGNVDQHGDLTPIDALLALRHFVGLATLESCQQQRADVDQSGTITPADTLCILQRFLARASCLGPASPQARLVPVLGNGVQVPVTHAQALAVRVQDATGAPVVGQAVMLSILEAPESSPSPSCRVIALAPALTRQQVRTDADGRAGTTLILGNVAGDVIVQARGTNLQPAQWTVTGVAERSSARIIRLGGNLSVPGGLGQVTQDIVSQLVDQYCNPLPDATLTATRRPSTTSPAGATVAGGLQNDLQCMTAADGTCAIPASIIPDGIDACFEITVPEIQDAAPTPRCLVVGAVDTLAFVDLAVNRVDAIDFVFIADSGSVDRSRQSLLRVIAVPIARVQERQEVAALDLPGTEVRLALDPSRARAYVGTDGPTRLHVLDISEPARLTDAAILGTVDFPRTVRADTIRGIAVQGNLVYVVTAARSTTMGSLQVINVAQPARPRIVASLALPGQPRDLAIHDANGDGTADAAYVPAGVTGLLVLDIRAAANPTLRTILGAATSRAFAAGITVSGPRAYTVETRCEPDCTQANAGRDQVFTVLDLRNSLAPVRQGTDDILRVCQGDAIAALAVSESAALAFLVRGARGLQAFDVSNAARPSEVNFVQFRARNDLTSVALDVATSGTLIYATDQIAGVLVTAITDADTDNDGVADFRDACPRDPLEAADTDGNGACDNEDPDIDGDGSPNDEEEARGTDPFDCQDVLPPPPPPGASGLFVDASRPPGGNGTAQQPYRSLTEAFVIAQNRPDLPPETPQTIHVLPGTYSPTTTLEIFPLELVPHLTLQGEMGAQLTVIDGGFSDSIVDGIAVSDITVENLTLIHGGDGVFYSGSTAITLRQNAMTENSREGVFIEGRANHAATNVTLMDNTVHDNLGSGVFIDSAESVTISNNTIRDNHGEGLGLNGITTLTIRGNIIRSNDLAGINILNSNAVQIINNPAITANTLEGIVFERSMGTISTNPNISNNGATGILLLNATTTISGNRIRNNNTGNHAGESGIGVFNSPGVATSVQITANTIQNNPGPGIDLDNATATTVDSNTIQSNTSGISVNNSTEVQITTNTVSSSMFEGITLDNNSTGTISGNVVRDNLLTGILLTNSTALIGANTVQDNSLTGILLTSSTAMIRGNTVQRNGVNSGDPGIQLERSVAPTVQDNTLDANGEGLFVTNSTAVQLIANVIANSLFTGLTLTNNSTATLTDNTIRDNGQARRNPGVLIERSTADIVGGAITNNTDDGVAITGSSTANIGLQGETITIGGNGACGIFAGPNAEVAINSDTIDFTPRNPGGNICGNVTDHAN